MPKINEQTLEQWFDYWFANNYNLSATAREFKRSRSTIFRACQKYRWRERATKIVTNIRSGHDRRIVKEAVSNLEIAKSILKRELEKYAGNQPTGKIREIMQLIEYIDQVQGNLPPDPSLLDEGETRTPMQVDEIVDALLEAQERRKNRHKK